MPTITIYPTTVREHNHAGDAGWTMATVVIHPQSHIAWPMHATPNIPWWARTVERQPGQRGRI